MSGTEETPREFVLKDKTWNGFADLLFDIYKEMASEKGYIKYIIIIIKYCCSNCVILIFSLPGSPIF